MLTLSLPAAHYELGELRAGTAPREQRQELRLYDVHGALLCRLCLVWPKGAQQAPVILTAAPRHAGQAD